MLEIHHSGREPSKFSTLTERQKAMIGFFLFFFHWQGYCTQCCCSIPVLVIQQVSLCTCTDHFRTNKRPANFCINTFLKEATLFNQITFRPDSYSHDNALLQKSIHPSMYMDGSRWLIITPLHLNDVGLLGAKGRQNDNPTAALLCDGSLVCNKQGAMCVLLLLRHETLWLTAPDTSLLNE